ncbi:ribosome silencing factor [Pseudohoeflea coraliihabitans]|uniref:Ribosomal silencing factor RsfS n=1 Tax=Pseudohoeflea coraliihabitans TaxID=2860393 RepID=A0ABS6WL78_9HYPH|nr:ribosome silencing factor [Pseudohoeflea sp. DP4N28-3]MBW3096703.1 ribosome silencing factor [Pseudohoeflea sp. DP4N28-3]
MSRRARSVCSKLKGTTLRTAQPKGNAEGTFSPVAENSGNAALRQLQLIRDSLADSKAQDIVCIDITGKSALGDHMIVASGRSSRHVTAICDHLMRDIKNNGFGAPKIEGLTTGDWVLIDSGDVIVHVFRPEIREFYNIEKMWQAPEIPMAAETEQLH